MNTSNELFKEEKKREYTVISDEYPKPEREIETKLTLEKIVSPKIAYYKMGSKLNIKL